MGRRDRVYEVRAEEPRRGRSAIGADLGPDRVRRRALWVGVDCTPQRSRIVGRLTRRDREVDSDHVDVDLDSRATGRDAFSLPGQRGRRAGRRASLQRYRDQPRLGRDWKRRSPTHRRAEREIGSRSACCATARGGQAVGIQVRRFISARQEARRGSRRSARRRRRNVALRSLGPFETLPGSSSFELRPFALTSIARLPDRTYSRGDPSAAISSHLTPTLTSIWPSIPISRRSRRSASAEPVDLRKPTTRRSVRSFSKVRNCSPRRSKCCTRAGSATFPIHPRFRTASLHAQYRNHLGYGRRKADRHRRPPIHRSVRWPRSPEQIASRPTMRSDRRAHCGSVDGYAACACDKASASAVTSVRFSTAVARLTITTIRPPAPTCCAPTATWSRSAEALHARRDRRRDR